MSEDCHIWDKTEETWITADFNWNEICVAVEVIGAVGGGYSGQLSRLKRRNKEDQKTFIKLICKIKGEKFEQTKWFRPNVNVKASDFYLVERELSKPELQIFINKNR